MTLVVEANQRNAASANMENGSYRFSRGCYAVCQGSRFMDPVVVVLLPAAGLQAGEDHGGGSWCSTLLK